MSWASRAGSSAAAEATGGLSIRERAIRIREKTAARIIVSNLLKKIEQRARSGSRGDRGVQMDMLGFLTDDTQAWFMTYMTKQVREGLRAARMFETALRDTGLQCDEFDSWDIEEEEEIRRGQTGN